MIGSTLQVGGTFGLLFNVAALFAGEFTALNGVVSAFSAVACYAGSKMKNGSSAPSPAPAT